MLYILVLVALAYYIISYYRWTAKYPRGPLPLPLIGNVFQFDRKRVYIDLAKYAKKYGDIFTIFIPTPMVIIAAYEPMREAFLVKGDDCSGRPDNRFGEIFSFGRDLGVTNSDGQIWKEQRRNALNILRDFGMGKNLMEQKVKLSITEYLACLKNTTDKNRVELRWPIQLMIANIINETLFGFRYDYNNCDELMNFVNTFNKVLEEITDSPLFFAALKYDWLQKIPHFGYYAYGRHMENMDKLRDFIRKQVDKVTADYDPNTESDCFVAAYRQRMPHNEWLTELQLFAVCFDFFMAGQETTTNTLRWAMLLLAKHQHIQDKVRSEILSVVGKSSLPSMADKPNMPYTSSTILEIQRVANIIGFSIMHRTTNELEIQGMRIPNNTLVTGNIHYVLSHDHAFEDPEVFRPERFLSADETTLNKQVVERCVPFSIGKRQCAGEALARVELFLGITSTLQHYNILPPLDGSINLEPICKIMHMPHEHQLQLIALDN